MIDKLEWRKVALDNDILKEFNAYKKAIFKNDPNASYEDYMTEMFQHFGSMYPQDLIKQTIQLLGNGYKRRQRCYSKTSSLMSNNKYVWFGTLTFNDATLSKTTIETRRRYVSRYLKSISLEYIANLDYGDKVKNPQSNEREHYHCLVACDHIPQAWCYGFCKFEKVGCCDLDSVRVSKYIAKLTNHSMKVERTGKARRLIYSRVNTSIPFWLLE